MSKRTTGGAGREKAAYGLVNDAAGSGRPSLALHLVKQAVLEARRAGRVERVLAQMAAGLHRDLFGASSKLTAVILSR